MYKEQYSEAAEQLEDMQEKINEYKQNEKSEEATVSLLEKDIKETKMKLGLTNVSGEGITIKMEALEDYTYSDLLELVN